MIMGGEPLLQKDVIELVKKINSLGYLISIESTHSISS